MLPYHIVFHSKLLLQPLYICLLPCINFLPCLQTFIPLKVPKNHASFCIFVCIPIFFPTHTLLSPRLAPSFSMSLNVLSSEWKVCQSWLPDSNYYILLYTYINMILYRIILLLLIIIYKFSLFCIFFITTLSHSSYLSLPSSYFTNVFYP